MDISVVKLHPEQIRSREYLVTIDAVDPDGMISELAIDLGDGTFIWLLLACPAQAGEPVTQEISWTYAPGEYTIEAVGFSTSQCFSGTIQQSRPATAQLTVP